MILDALPYIPVVLLLATTMVLFITQDWRQYFAALAIQYLAVFWLVSLSWPTGLAVVKLVVGWMATALLGTSQWDVEMTDESLADPPGRLFRILAGGLIWLVVAAFVPEFRSWFPIPTPILLGSFLLIGMGLLQLAMHNHPLRIIIGLLSMLSGFEILYAVVENSVLVAGLLAVVNLGLVLVGIYLLSLPTEELQDSDEEDLPV